MVSLLAYAELGPLLRDLYGPRPDVTEYRTGEVLRVQHMLAYRDRVSSNANFLASKRKPQ